MAARRRVLAVLAAGVIAVSLPAPYDAASASCVGPVLEVGDATRPTVAPGQGMKVVGRYFVDGCGDTGAVRSYGCSGERQVREPVRPLSNITLSIRQAGHVWILGNADAHGQLGTVNWVVILTASLEPGRATLVTDRSRGLRVVVR